MQAREPATHGPSAHGDPANGATHEADRSGRPGGREPAAEAKKLVAAARAAQWYWRQETLDARIDAMRRAARGMLRRRHEVMALAHREMGKVPAEAIFNEALGPLDTVNGWAQVVRASATRRSVALNPISFARKTAAVDYVPRGVVGVIAPWNYPAAGLYRSVFPALMTGNAVILKPSERTPETSAWIAERLADELPRGIVQVLPGDGRAGAALVDAGIDACVFTGSARHGATVRVRCAERGIPSSIEMGGKDAAIVLDDCDLPRTVAGITHWALSNAGQACGAIEVAYVERSVADDFVEAMRRAWTRLTATSVAPLGNGDQLAIVERHVAEARARGGVIVCGGVEGREGLWHPPTIVDGCNESMAIVAEETFGPVLAIVRIDGVMEAVRSINRSRYGLGASIWSRDIARARRIAERLEVGVVSVNNHAFSGAIPGLPWTGTRGTGFGVANGPESLQTFVRPRTTTVDQGRGPDLYWMPYDDALTATGEALAEAQLGQFANAWKLPLLVRRRLRTVRDFFRRER